MNIALINVKTLTRVRETFRPGWRIFIAIIFLLAVFFWLAALHQLKSLAPIVNDATVRTRTLILAAVVLPPLAVGLFRKDYFGRLFFALATAFNLATIALLMLVCLYGLLTERGVGQALVFLILVVLFMLWVYQLRHCYVSWLSLIPFGRWKVYRQQVNLCLRLWSGEWKGLEGPEEVGAGETPYLTPGTPYRLALGWLSFALGVVAILTVIFSFANDEFLPAVGRLELSRAWQMLSSFETTPPDSGSSVMLHATNTISVFILGMFFFFAFGYFRTQWQREHVRIYSTPLLRHMTPRDLLLLRSFSDDVKSVTRSTNNPVLGILRAYGWSFTFEQMIVNRLRYLGRVRLVDIKQDREELLREWGKKVIARVRPAGLHELLTSVARPVWAALRGLLMAVFPAVWYRLPAQGGVRTYLEGERGDEKWRAEIGVAIARARAIIVLLGTTDSLLWEMGQIRKLGFAEKTLFVMPPLIIKKKYRARWEQFAGRVCAASEEDRRRLEKVNPKRVLAAVVRGDTLVVLTAGRRLHTAAGYESALDVATILTVADPAQARRLIPRYLK